MFLLAYRRCLLQAGLILVLVSLSFTAFACGESLFRVGKGVDYREYTAPLPGNLVLVANSEAELAMAERLEAAGHRVQVVSQPAELQAALDTASVDIVLALFSQREAVETAMARSSAQFLPVVAVNSDEEQQVRDRYPHALSTSDGVKQFLRTIHKTLKQREA